MFFKVHVFGLDAYRFHLVDYYCRRAGLLYDDEHCCLFHCRLQVEIQVRKLYCVNRAVSNLPINIEDAARSEREFEKAEAVSELI